MTIGYSVEGSTDRAVLVGLRNRWCPDADLEEGPFRGTTLQSRRREYRKMCDAFALKGIAAVVFLADGDGEDWRAVQVSEKTYIPAERLHQIVFGVPDRNIECWLCYDARWLSAELGTDAERFMVDDPKNAFERAIGITRDDKKEAVISDLVGRAPLQRWIAHPSFEDFYEQVRDLSQRLGCEIENVRDAVH